MRITTLDGVKIAGVAACVPPVVVDNKTAGAELFGERIEDTIKVTGVKERRVCSDGVTALDLSIAAAQRLLSEIEIKREDIGGVIFVTQTPDYDIPNNSSRAVNLLGLSHDCAAVDSTFGCSGYVYGLWLAGLMARSLNAPVLLLDGEAHSRFTSPHDRATALLFGDAGSATLIVPHDDKNNRSGEITRSWHFGFMTDGSKSDILIVPEGRSRLPFNEHSLEYREWPDGGVRRPIDIKMDGMAVFDFVVRNVPRCLTQLMQSAEIAASDVELLLMHQANLFMIQQVAKMLKISRDRMPISLDRFGNSSSATLPVTMCSSAHETITTRNNRTLMAGFGAGLSIAVAALDLGPCVCPPIFDYNAAKQEA